MHPANPPNAPAPRLAPVGHCLTGSRQDNHFYSTVPKLLHGPTEPSKCSPAPPTSCSWPCWTGSRHCASILLLRNMHPALGPQNPPNAPHHRGWSPMQRVGHCLAGSRQYTSTLQLRSAAFRLGPTEPSKCSPGATADPQQAAVGHCLTRSRQHFYSTAPKLPHAPRLGPTETSKPSPAPRQQLECSKCSLAPRLAANMLQLAIV